MDETAKKKLKVRVMMQAMLLGVQEIAKQDLDLLDVEKVGYVLR